MTINQSVNQFTLSVRSVHRVRGHVIGVPDSAWWPLPVLLELHDVRQVQLGHELPDHLSLRSPVRLCRGNLQLHRPGYMRVRLSARGWLDLWMVYLTGLPDRLTSHRTGWLVTDWVGWLVDWLAGYRLG